MSQSPQPLRALFMLSSMPVGGAETLLVNLMRRFDPERVVPEVCCLKDPGPLGETVATEFQVHTNFIRHKFDVGVIWRLSRLMQQQQYDAVITVGAGDKMFWGRIAARLAGVPMVASALHSTGWPDGIGRLNRLLTPITDAFIAVAERHGQFLRDHEQLPEKKVFVIPNGVDTERFVPAKDGSKPALRQQLGLPLDVPLCCIVAALRPEKNHQRFLRIASLARRHNERPPQFVIVGDGPTRRELEETASQLGLQDAVHFLGARSDIPQLLSACDVFMLTSDNEASPVSIMEAMACGLPVIAPNVGSIADVVQHGETGFVHSNTDERAFAASLNELCNDSTLRARLGQAAANRIHEVGSLTRTVAGYEALIHSLVHRPRVRRSQNFQASEYLAALRTLTRSKRHAG